VKVTNNVVGVVIDDVETSVRENKTSESTKSEACKEAHYDNKFNANDVSSEKSRDSCEDLDSSRYSDNHSSRTEVESRIFGDTSDVHVVSPYKESNYSDTEDS
jgi:hypothetical protein